MDGTCGRRHADQAEAQAHVDEMDRADRTRLNVPDGVSLYTGRAVILQTE